MGYNFSVLKSVDLHLIDKAKNNNRDYKHFHASDFGGCHRKIGFLYYEAHKLISLDPKLIKYNPKMERIFDHGHVTHDRWRTYLTNIGILQGRWMCQNYWAHPEPKIYGEDNTKGIFKPEKCECGSDKFSYVELGYFDEETNWGGHVDAILNVEGLPEPQLANLSRIVPHLNLLPEPEFLLDFKTINPFEFKTLTAPQPKHFTQIQIYLFFTGLKHGKFIYENKADQDVKEFDVPRDDEFIETKKQEAIKLKYFLTHRNSRGKLVLPDMPEKLRLAGPGHTECMRCKYRGECWKAHEAKEAGAKQ